MDHRAIVNRPRPPAPPAPRPERSGPGAPHDDGHPRGAPPRRPTSPRDAVPVKMDQAVFTSLRSPMGEGYRIVAASSGIRPEERAEITRQSPSHRSMTDESPRAVGLLAYPLATGRYCVCHCRCAGTEHTGRGGQRIWTHVALLDRETYNTFGCNPVRVHRALAGENSRAPQLSPGAVLPELTLGAWSRARTPPPLDGDGLHRLLSLVSALLQGGRWVVSGRSTSLAVLEWAFELIPPAARPVLAVSCGLAFCLSRRVNLTFVGTDKGGVRHMIRGQDIRWCDLDASGVDAPSAFDDWIDMLRSQASAKRLHRIAGVTARVTAGAEPVRLRRLAQLLTDAEAAPCADEPARAALQRKYASFIPNSDLERELLDTVMVTVKSKTDRT